MKGKIFLVSIPASSMWSGELCSHLFIVQKQDSLFVAQKLHSVGKK
jgi:hypothetical protein